MRRRADLLAEWRDAEHAGDAVAFERLRDEYADLDRGDRVLMPAANPQYVPSTSTSRRDCVAATTAQLVEAATVGAAHTDHAAIRKASGAPATRGLYLHEAAAAAKKVAGVELEVSLGNSRNTVRDTVAGGSRASITISCAVTRYTKRRTSYYTGLHQVTLLAYVDWPAGERCACEKETTARHGEFTVYDTGMTTVPARQWSADLVYRAAEAATGVGHMNLLVGPDTEGVRRVAVRAGKVYSKPYRSSPTRGDIAVGSPYLVVATTNGGGWPRADGSTAYGWHEVKRATGTAFIPGRNLK